MNSQLPVAKVRAGNAPNAVVYGQLELLIASSGLAALSATHTVVLCGIQPLLPAIILFSAEWDHQRYAALGL